MSTTLFPHVANWVGEPDIQNWSAGTGHLKLVGTASAWYRRSLDDSPGASWINLSTNTVDGPTAGIEVVGTSSQPNDWVSAPVAADVTISGSIAFYIWCNESSMSANAAINCVIEKIDGATLAITEIINTTRTTEMGTSLAAASWSESPPAGVTLHKGDRLRLRIYADDSSTMNAGYTYTVGIDAPSAGSGYTYVTFTETFSFQTTDPTGTTYYPLDDYSSIDPFGSSGLLIDDFNRANADPIGGDWHDVNTGSSTEVRLVSNQAAGESSAGTSEAAAYYFPTGISFRDLELWATVAALPSTDEWVGVARYTGVGGAGTFDGYALRYKGQSGTDLLEITRVDNIVHTQLVSTNIDLSANDKIALRTLGTTIQGWVYQSGAWTKALETTDSSYAQGALAITFGGLAAGTGRLDDVRQGWPVLDMSQSRGSVAANTINSTASGWTEPIRATDNPGSGTAIEWMTPPLEAFTLAGLVKLNIRSSETAGAANAALHAELAVVDGDGTNATVWARNVSPNELSFGETAEQWYLSGDDLSVTEGQRLRFRVYVDDDMSSGPLVAGYQARFFYNGPTAAASGDSYITLQQTVTEIVVSSDRAPLYVYNRKALQAIKRSSVF